MSEPLFIRPLSAPRPAPPLFAPTGRLTIAEPGHPLRESFEAFVEARFAACFDARLSRHYPRLAGMVGADGAPRAVAGVRFADEEPLFLERYLDTPIETALPVFADRDRIAEIGSLASDGPYAAIAFFARLAVWLRCEQDRRIAAATVTPTLQRLLRGAGFDLTWLAAADPARLGGGRADWGGYYETSPAVFAADIPLGRPLPGPATDAPRRMRSLSS